MPEKGCIPFEEALDLGETDDIEVKAMSSVEAVHDVEARTICMA